MKINLRQCFFVIMVTLFSFFKVSAQETTSEIQGTISNLKQNLAGAAVTALHTPTGTLYKTTTRQDGGYNFPNIKIGGPYTITVSFIGFKSEKQEDVYLTVGQSFKQNFVLAEDVKTLNEVIVKSTNDKNFNSNRNGSQELITRTQLDRLPTISRSIQDFVKLEPTANGMNIGGRSNQYNNY